MDSAISRAMHPKTWEWTLPAQLAANLYNAQVAPKYRVTIPGSEDEQEKVVTGKGAVPVDEFNRFWYGDGGGEQ